MFTLTVTVTRQEDLIGQASGSRPAASHKVAEERTIERISRRSWQHRLLLTFRENASSAPTD